MEIPRTPPSKMSPAHTITIDGGLDGLGAWVRTWTVEGLDIPESAQGLDALFDEELVRINGAYDLDGLKDDPSVRALRDFFWKVGIDPTKKRPASEALVRRILQKGMVPRIHPGVDSGNLASIHTMVPIGLYDISRISTSLVLRRALEGEVFEAIGGKDLPMKGTEVVLVDAADEHLIHQYPYRDCRRSSLRLDTTGILVVGCGVPGIPDESVRDAGRMTVDNLERHCHGRCTSDDTRWG